MYKVLTFNTIPVKGLEELPRQQYETGTEISQPDVVLLRSQDLRDWQIPDSLKAVGRAGVGVDNIPVDRLTARGVPVFNAPGANANAVKELVLAGMLMSARGICAALEFTARLEGSDQQIKQAVEAGKKRFKGIELKGRTLGVIGLGSVGVQVANAAHSLGMRVVGYDAHMSLDNAWRLSSSTVQAGSIGELLQQSDFVTLHVPLSDTTRALINTERLAHLPEHATLLNFSRDAIVDEAAITQALQSGRLRRYVTDFPSLALKGVQGVLSLPHLGASTTESEDNCAVMVAQRIRAFLEHGTIRNSVNFPNLEMPRSGGCRFVVVHTNVPRMLEGITAAIADADINIVDLLNKSRGEIACTLVDIECQPPESVVTHICGVEGVLAVYAL